VELEEVALLVELVGVAVEEGEYAEQLRERVSPQLHDGRLVRLYHRHWALGGSRVGALVLSGRGRCALAVDVVVDGSRGGLRREGRDAACGAV
jgi:hypothetical protein